MESGSLKGPPPHRNMVRGFFNCRACLLFVVAAAAAARRVLRVLLLLDVVYRVVFFACARFGHFLARAGGSGGGGVSRFHSRSVVCWTRTNHENRSVQENYDHDAQFAGAEKQHDGGGGGG